MAAIQGKHSASRTQGLLLHPKTRKTGAFRGPQRRAAHASTKTHALAKTKALPKPKSSSKAKSKKRRWISRVPKPRIIKHGKTTIRRYNGREFHRFEEIQGKTVDYAEVFTSGEYHSIAIYFQDKTLLHFTIDPGFTLETQYADTQTGDWRTRKRWPLLHSQTLRA